MEYNELTSEAKKQVENRLKKYCAAEAYLKHVRLLCLTESPDVVRRMKKCKERIIKTREWFEQNHIEVKMRPSENILDFKFIFKDVEETVNIGFYRLELERIHSL